MNIKIKFIPFNYCVRKKRAFKNICLLKLSTVVSVNLISPSIVMNLTWWDLVEQILRFTMNFYFHESTESPKPSSEP